MPFLLLGKMGRLGRMSVVLSTGNHVPHAHEQKLVHDNRRYNKLGAV